jgi:hypothetical protein
MLCASLILGLHLVSYHTPKYDWQQNVNPGAYVECNGLTAGAYRNTFDRTSAYAGYTWHSGVFSLSLGAISGYDRRTVYDGPVRHGDDCDVARCTHYTEWRGSSGARLQPFVAPSVTFGPARITIIPYTGQHSSTTIHLSIQRTTP